MAKPEVIKHNDSLTLVRMPDGQSAWFKKGKMMKPIQRIRKGNG